MSNAADLFAPIAGDADPRATAGLELLMRTPPLWPMDRGVFWTDQVARARAFAERRDAPCRTHGWSGLQLYGVDRNAPGARIGSLGVDWVVASPSRP